jgi:hypothetical protein
MLSSCSKGNKGRLKALGLEFEIIDTTSDTSKIQIRGSRDEPVWIKDEDLKQCADDIRGVSP